MHMLKLAFVRLYIRPGLYGPCMLNGTISIDSGVEPIFDVQGQIGYRRIMPPVIKIREENGKEVKVPKGRFVEICDESDKIACLIYYTNQGSVRVVMPDDLKEVEYYKNIFHVDFCKSVVDVSPSIDDRINPH